jgi:hypothetical protein
MAGITHAVTVYGLTAGARIGTGIYILSGCPYCLRHDIGNRSENKQERNDAVKEAKDKEQQK